MSSASTADVVTGVDFVSVPTRDLERSVAFYDPDGNALMLHHRYAPREPERQ